MKLQHNTKKNEHWNMKLGEYVRKKKKYTHFTTKIMKMHFKTSLKRTA